MKQIQIKRETVAQTRLKVRFDRVLFNHLKNEFNKVSKLFVPAYNDNKSIEIVKVAHQKRVHKILTAVLGETTKTFSDRIVGKSNYHGFEIMRQSDEFSLSIQK